MALIKRVIMGAILLIAAIVVVLHSKWAMALLIFPIGIIGGMEFYRLSIMKQIKPSVKNGIFSIVAIYLTALLSNTDYTSEVFIVLSLITISIFVLHKEQHVSSFLDAGVTILGYLYIGRFLSLLFNMRTVPGVVSAYSIHIDRGAALVLLLILVNSSTDIGGYFIGKAIGKRKLCAHISPNKTVGGALGSILSAMAVAAIFGRFLSLSTPESLLFGFLISIAAQLGDLWESTLKRDVEVKDSGDAIPGHGGVLDRFDSLFFSTPVAYYLFKYMIGF